MNASLIARALALASLLLAACTQTTPSAPSPTGTAAPTAAANQIPAPVAVTLDPKTTAVLSLDLINPTCPQRPQCVASLPKIADLLKRARDAKAAVVHSITTGAGVTINPQVAALPDEPTVAGPADKFYNTQLDQILKAKGVQTVVVTGTAANGAVLYTSFGANIRGYTVVVPEDTISVAPDLEFGIPFTKWQLLRQPGFTNVDNKPLEKGRVTLSRSDLVGFGAAPGAAGGGAPSAAPTSVSLPALNAVTLSGAKTAVLALDLINPTCGQRPQCVSSLGKIADLLKRARTANATVVYSLTTAPDAAIRPEVAPMSGETIVIGPADKFYNTTLDAFLKSKGVTHVIIVGTAAHGAVLYTSFGANIRGYTVIVPDDGISVGPGEEFGLIGTKWQLLNQPGFNNVSNLPLTAARVTLTVIEGVTFQP